MTTPFRLDEHPRRPQPLAPPPPGYFDTLPRRVMARVQPAEAEAGWSWRAALAGPLRPALSSVLVLGGFALTFLLSGPAAPTSPGSALAQVPRAELVQYLLANDNRLTLNDLAELSGTGQLTAAAYLQVSPTELQAALDAQPLDD